MNKKLLILLFSIFIVISVKSQNFSDTKSNQDTIFKYFNNGKIESWSKNNSGTISFMKVIDKGIYDKMFGEYKMIENSNDILKEGTWKWFTKEGILKDSVIYKNGAELYRARFNNDRSLQFENNSGFLVETNQIIEKCEGDFVVRFKNKKMTVLNSMILPTYQELGFYIVKNGVYDFVVDGKKYFQSVVLDINENGFLISKNWDFDNGIQKTTDSTFINISSNIQIRLLSMNNGVGNMPTRTKLEDYDIQIIKTDKYCQFINNEFISKEGKSIGHYYFTEYGLKNLKMKKGTTYLCEKTGDYIVHR